MKLALALAAMFVLATAASGQHSPFKSALQNLSTRTLVVVVTMIGEAQQRGAAFVDVNDRIIALIAEDQDERASLLFADDMTPSAVLSFSRRTSAVRGRA